LWGNLKEGVRLEDVGVGGRVTFVNIRDMFGIGLIGFTLRGPVISGELF
jgi:hypothetical protein